MKSQNQNKMTEHLKFIYERMKNVHSEREDVDYMIKLKEIIKEKESGVVKIRFGDYRKKNFWSFK